MKGMWKLHDLIESGRPVAGIGSISKLTQMAWLSLWPSLGTGLGQGEGQVKRLSIGPWFPIQMFNTSGSVFGDMESC